MLKTDIEDEIIWWQLFDVAESLDGSTWKSYRKLAEVRTKMTQHFVGYNIDVHFRTNFDGNAKSADFNAAFIKSFNWAV